MVRGERPPEPDGEQVVERDAAHAGLRPLGRLPVRPAAVLEEVCDRLRLPQRDPPSGHARNATQACAWAPGDAPQAFVTKGATAASIAAAKNVSPLTRTRKRMSHSPWARAPVAAIPRARVATFPIRGFGATLRLIVTDDNEGAHALLRTLFRGRRPRARHSALGDGSTSLSTP